VAGCGEAAGAGPRRPRRRPGSLAAAGAAARAGAGAVALVLALGGCGGGGGGTAEPFTVSLPTVRFPARQRVATPVVLRIVVRNDGDRALPDVAVSIDSFAVVDPAGAGPPRPAWIVDRAPTGAGSDSQTWALGSLAPGATRTFLWQVTPVRPGRYTVGYRVAPGLPGSAVAELSGGRPARGVFGVIVSGAAADSRVDPATGRVIRRAHIAP
jgi:hypothetical protein